MDYGKYNVKVKFISFQDVDDGYGGTSPQETVLLNTFARMIQVGARRDIEQMQIGMPKTYRIGIYKRKAYEPKSGHFVDFKGSIHVIKNVVDGEFEHVIDIVKNED